MLWNCTKWGLTELAKQCLLGSEKLYKLEFCDHLILDKQHKVKFWSDIHNSIILIDCLIKFIQVYGV